MISGRRKKKIRRSLPVVGAELRGVYLKKCYSAKIVEDQTRTSGKAVMFSGKRYGSLSTAAEAITKHPRNGWLFWKVYK